MRSINNTPVSQQAHRIMIYNICSDNVLTLQIELIILLVD